MQTVQNDPLIEKFINYIMLDGKKSLARKLLNETLEVMKSKGQKNPLETLKMAMDNVMPRVEVRPKRVGGSIYQVPQEVKAKRQMFLASKWILDAAKWKSGISFPQALAGEVIDASNDTGNAVKKKLDVYKMAEANKAFARFASR